jgi:hypothetical protein
MRRHLKDLFWLSPTYGCHKTTINIDKHLSGVQMSPPRTCVVCGECFITPHIPMLISVHIQVIVRSKSFCRNWSSNGISLFLFARDTWALTNCFAPFSPGRVSLEEQVGYVTSVVHEVSKLRSSRLEA